MSDDAGPKEPQPAGEPHPARFGLGRLASLPRPHTADLFASLSGAIAAVPDGMAASVVIGVSPAQGLYASIWGPIIGGVFSRTPLLLISTTSAGSLAAAEVVASQSGEQRLNALLLVTLFAGLFQVGASLLGLARLTSFVSHSVMTGFLCGIAVLIILGQLSTLAGYDPEGDNSILKTADLVEHAGRIDAATLAIGLLTIALLLAMQRLWIRMAAPILALIIPSVLVVIFSLDSVETVRDLNEIPSSIPLPALPSFSEFSLSLVSGAAALAAIVFVQTAGVSQGLPGPHRPDSQSGDLRASGIANAGVALLQGQPVGGSLGQSMLNIQAGARSRYAAIFSGLCVLVFVLLLANLIENIAMPALAALLIVAAVGAINVSEASWIWRTGWGPRLTILLTFALTLLLPIQLAVGFGVVFSALLYLSDASSDIQVREQVLLAGGGIEERDPPASLPSGAITVLQVYGSLFFAGARTLARLLPEVKDSDRPVAVLRLRGRMTLGATAIDVLAAYARSLRNRGGLLFLAGLSPHVVVQLHRSGKVTLTGTQTYEASGVLGESLGRAYRDAERWLVQPQDEA